MRRLTKEINKAEKKLEKEKDNPFAALVMPFKKEVRELRKKLEKLRLAEVEADKIR